MSPAPEPKKKTPGQILRERRVAAGLLQSDLAEALGVKQSTVSRWESDEQTPERDSQDALAELLAISVKMWPPERPKTSDGDRLARVRRLRKKLQRKRASPSPSA